MDRLSLSSLLVPVPSPLSRFLFLVGLAPRKLCVSYLPFLLVPGCTLVVRGIVDDSLSRVCLACSKETLPLSSLLLPEKHGKEIAWCALIELLHVTSRPVTKL
jgi:hypothetical protein